MSDTLLTPFHIEDRFLKFQTLKELHLRGNEFGYDASVLKFPDSVQLLDLRECSIETINEVRFPKSLLRLDLLGNKLKSIYRPHFPKHMKVLDLSYNQLIMLDLSFNALGERLEIELFKRLYETDNFIDHAHWRLPSGIVTYDAELCGPVELDSNFRASLIYLNLKGSDWRHSIPPKLDSCSNLTYLKLGKSSHTFNNTPLPPSLEEVELWEMDLAEVPSQLSALPRLRALNLSNNMIKHVDIKLSSSIETLDLSFNQIESFLLSFWGNDKPRLGNLLLSRNRLKEITAESLGFKSNVVHNEMYQLDLTYNEGFVMNQGLLTLLSRSTLQYLWLTEVNGRITNKARGRIYVYE